MLSLFGTWIVEGFWEKVLVPAGMVDRSAVDLDRSKRHSQISAEEWSMHRDAAAHILPSKDTSPFAIKCSKMFGLLRLSNGKVWLFK